jgi:DNA mismatch endonuclease (patch repair protein)
MQAMGAHRHSERMSRVRSRDTTPEVAVRRRAHRLGYRFRLHTKNLPGKPDLVFASGRRVIFVNGRFWHRHPGCRRASMPASNISFWENRFAVNMARDRRVLAELEAGGWSVLVIWECQTRSDEQLDAILQDFLAP